MATDPDMYLFYHFHLSLSKQYFSINRGVRRACVQGLGEVVKSTGVKEVSPNKIKNFKSKSKFFFLKKLL